MGMDANDANQPRAHGGPLGFQRAGNKVTHSLRWNESHVVRFRSIVGKRVHSTEYRQYLYPWTGYMVRNDQV